MDKRNSSKYFGIVDLLKAKLIEAGKDYLQANIEKSKNTVFKIIEKNFEKKIKFEIKKYLFKIIAFILLGVSLLFLLYGLIEIIFNLLTMPQFLINMIFGVVLFIFGMVFFLIYN